MAYIGSTNYKNGDMPQMMKWIYIMILKHHGYVTSYREERFPHDFNLGWKTVMHYTIKAPGMTLDVTIDDEAGIIDGNMNIERDFSPIYELGSSHPAEYVSGRSQIYYRSA